MNTKEVYFTEVAELAVNALVEAYRKIYGLADDETTAQNKTRDMIINRLDISEEELSAIWNGHTDEAYDIYVENSEPLHDYEVTISVNYAATVHVKAKDEDEAREYVEGNLCTNSTEVYMGGYKNVIEDIDTGVDFPEWEIEDVCDCGEYEE